MKFYVTLCYNVTQTGVFKSRNLTSIYMVTFKGHAVASLSCERITRITFQLGFDATLFFGFSFLPSSSPGCSNALVPLPRKSRLLICHAFVKMKQKNIYIKLYIENADVSIQFVKAQWQLLLWVRTNLPTS